MGHPSERADRYMRKILGQRAPAAAPTKEVQQQVDKLAEIRQRLINRRKGF